MKNDDLIARAEHNGKAFEIVSDNPEHGFYFFVREGDKCTQDYVLDSVDQCKEFGAERFNVPLDAWRNSK